MAAQQQTRIDDWQPTTDCHHLDDYAMRDGAEVYCMRCQAIEQSEADLAARRDQLADQGASNFGGLE